VEKVFQGILQSLPKSLKKSKHRYIALLIKIFYHSYIILGSNLLEKTSNPQLRILFVLDELPFPPRNGITIPTFNYLSRFSENHDVSLLFLKKKHSSLKNSFLEKNKSFVHNLWLIERERHPAVRRIVDELSGKTPYFFGMAHDSFILKKELKNQHFDVVWASPLSVTEVIPDLMNLLGPKPIYFASISDCLTAVLRTKGKRFFSRDLSLKLRFVYGVNWIRSWIVAGIESKILHQYNLIGVQTEEDRKWLNAISSGSLDNKVIVLPNGANEQLMERPVNSSGKDILYFAILSGGHGKVLEWILQKVWPAIKPNARQTKFVIVGKGASAKLKRLIDNDDRIEYFEYIADIRSIFDDKAIMLAPVFMEYGLINKVVDSMAAGVPVIGDKGSFNGIVGFENGRHGIVANGPQSFAKSALQLLNSIERRREIASEARALITNSFSWSDRIKSIDSKLKSMISGASG
jgi:glycosyltransferase involved in cell wall biosynthesis